MKFEDYTKILKFGIFLEEARKKDGKPKSKYVIKFTKDYVKLNSALFKYFLYSGSLYFSNPEHLNYVLITAIPPEEEYIKAEFDCDGYCISDNETMQKLREMFNVTENTTKFEYIAVSDIFSTPISIKDFFAVVITD